MYEVEIIHSQGYSFQVKSKDYEFRVDAKGVEGITPPDTLLASIGTCIGVYINKYAEGAKLSLKGFKINVTAEFSKEAPVCFRKISVIIDLNGAQLEERRIKPLLDFIKNCPVHNTLKSNPEVEVSVK